MQVSLSLSVPSHDVLLLLSFGTLALWGAGLSLGNDTIVKVLLWHISGWKMFLHPTPAMEDEWWLLFLWAFGWLQSCPGGFWSALSGAVLAPFIFIL
jgi:hypothetical protein